MVEPTALGSNITDIIVGAAAILGAFKSAYNGYIRTSYESLKAIERVEQQMTHVESKQEEMVDALVALARAQNRSDIEVDPQQVKRNFDRIDRAEEYLIDDDATRQGARSAYESDTSRQSDDDDD